MTRTFGHVAVACAALFLGLSGSAVSASAAGGPFISSTEPHSLAQARLGCQGERYADDVMVLEGCLQISEYANGDLISGAEQLSPVAGVSVVATKRTGVQIGQTMSAPNGYWAIPLSGDIIDWLGKTITVTLDTSSLPNNTVSGEETSVTRRLMIEAPQFYYFALRYKENPGSDAATTVPTTAGDNGNSTTALDTQQPAAQSTRNALSAMPTWAWGLASLSLVAIALAVATLIRQGRVNRPPPALDD